MFSKIAKTPPLSKKTKLLCFDLETNGLHGPAFAVGAVVMGYDGTIDQEFTARCEIEGQVDEFTQKNILPAVSDMPTTHKDYKDLRSAFWDWYLQNEPKTDYILVSNGYPVEYRFLLACQEDNLDERYWQHPFPILDLASLLVQLETKPEKPTGFRRHHPLDDAKVSALRAFQAFELSGRIR